jgi:hypothetical protein
MMTGESLAQNYVGIILQGQDKDCTIMRKGEKLSCSTRHLFLGDVIEQKTSVKDLKIKWAPNVSGKEIDRTRLEVVLKRQPELKTAEYTKMVGAFVNDFVKPAEHKTVSASTRAGSSPANCKKMLLEKSENLPSRATLLMDTPIVLSWQISGIRKFIVMDARAEKVFEKDVRNRSEISFSAAEAGLKRGETYSWRFDAWDTKEVNALSVLSEQSEYEILDGLAKLDADKNAAREKTINKAAFLQMISDDYPDMIDLYWLSLQLLPKISVNDTHAEAVCGLKLRYINHFSEL